MTNLSNTIVRSMLALTLSMTLLQGCALGLTRIPADCPTLPPPTKEVVAALDTVGHADAKSGAWVIALNKHYEKLDACKP